MPLVSPTSQPEIAVDHGTGYELAQSLLCYLDVDEAALFPESAAWRRKLEDRIPAGLEADLEMLAGCPFVCLNLAALASEAPPPRDAAGLIEVVRATRPAELVAALLGGRTGGLSVSAAAGEMRRALAGRPAERRALVARWARDLRDAEVTAAVTLLEQPAAGTKRRLLHLLERWHRHVFGPDEPSLATRLAADAARTAALAGRLPATELLETVTNGVRLSEWTSSRRILLVPQVAMGPWNASTQWGDVLIITHPVAASPGPPDAEQVARLYKALGDESRLRLLQALTAGERTLAQLTEAVGLAKSTAHHHLTILRAAGLVVSSLDDDRHYQLRDEAIAAAGRPLQELLGVSGLDRGIPS